VLQAYCATGILCYRHTVLQEYCATGILCYRHTVLQAYSATGKLCYRHNVLRHTLLRAYCAKAYSATGVLCYRHTVLQAYCATGILCYRHTVLQEYSATGILCYRHTVLQANCATCLPTLHSNNSISHYYMMETRCLNTTSRLLGHRLDDREIGVRLMREIARTARLNKTKLPSIYSSTNQHLT